MPRLLVASPQRYPDLARLWHRCVMRDLVPSFARLDLDVEVNIFCDANRDQFVPDDLPGVRFSSSGPGIRDSMEFYDAALHEPCDFLLFLDADTFILDGDWAGSYFKAFHDPATAGVSFVPRRGAPAIFALMCRAESFRSLPAPAFSCRYEFPQDWPNGVNLQPGDFAVRELARAGNIIINIAAEESSLHTVNFRGTTGIRALREFTTRAAREEAFRKFIAENPLLLIAAYDNVLLGCLYEGLYHEPFAADAAGIPLGGSLSLAELRQALGPILQGSQREFLRERFQQSWRNILRMADRERIELSIASVSPDQLLG